MSINAISTWTCTGVRLCQSKPHSCKMTYDTFRLYERRYDTERQEGIMMRLGDYILCASMTLNVLAMVAYAYQGVWHLAWYWLAALQLNAAILWGMR